MFLFAFSNQYNNIPRRFQFSYNCQLHSKYFEIINFTLGLSDRSLTSLVPEHLVLHNNNDQQFVMYFIKRDIAVQLLIFACLMS
jgi:hypothetical protein